MLAGALEISLMADLSRLNDDMQRAKGLTNDSMGAMAGAMAIVQKAIDAMSQAETARASVFSRTMDETKRLLGIVKGAADQTAKSLAELKINPDALSVPDSAYQDLNTWQERYAAAIGTGMAVGMEKLKTGFDETKSYIETKVVIWGVALAIGVTAAVAGAVYSAYKAISFGVGLLTGESYKSANIDALVAMNKEVAELQGPLQVTATRASALNETFKTLGVSAGDYTSAILGVASATRSNGDELDRLGVKYKDQRGELLDTKTVMQNASDVLATYTAGWDRDQAAKAIGIGSEKQIQDALSVTAEKIQTAKDRLIEYGLIIGPGTQEAIKKYEDSMRAFGRETDLTSQGFKRAIADNIMPILTDLSDFFREGFPAAVQVFRGSIATITTLFYGLKTGVYIVAESVLGSVQAIGMGLSSVIAATSLAMSGDFASAKAALVTGWEDAKNRLGGIGDNIVGQVRNNNKAMALAWGEDSLNADKAAESIAKSGKKWVAAEKEKAAATQAASDVYGVLMAQIDKEMQSATQAIEMQRALTASEKFRTETLGKIDEAMRKGNITMEQAIELESAMHDAEGQRATADYLLEKIKMTHELYLENLKLVESYEKTIKGEADQSKALKLEIEMMALTLKGQAELTRTRSEAIIVTKQMELASIQAADAETGTMSRQQIALAEEIRLMQERNGLLGDKAALQQSINNFKTAWESVDRTAHDVFVSVAENGSNAFKKIGQTLKSAVLDLLYQMTLKKWLFDITASATGTATGVANAATGGVMSAVNGASSLNSIYGAGTQALYGGAAGSSSAGLMYANGVGMVGGDSIGALAAANGQWAGVAGASSLAQGTAGAAALEVGGTTAAGGGITAGLASVPVYGWIALAAIAAYAVFSKESKPSSSTGDAAMQFDAAGKQIGKVDNSQAAYKAYNNPAYDNIVTGLQADYASKAKALGIGAVESGFGFAGNTGKGGEKQNIAIIGQAGNSKYESGEVEKSDANMQLLAARAVFAALQGSDLPKFLKGSFDGLVAGNMQTADIANAITGAQALKGLHDNVLKMPFAGLADLSYTAMQGLLGLTGGVQGLTTGLASYYNNYYSAAEKTAATTKQVSEALAAVNVVMPKTREEFRAQMDAAIALGDAGAPMVAALLSVENAFAGIVPAAASAADALVQMQAQLQSKISNVIADYASSDEVRNFQAGGIQQTLAGGGVNLSVEQILSATRADARALYDSYAATGNTAAQSAILEAAKAFAALTPAVQAQTAQANAFGAGSSGSSSGGAGLTSAVNAMTTAANNIVSAMQSLTQSLLVTGGPDGVARLEAQFAIEVAQAKAGDLAAAQDLPALSKLLADAYKTSSASAVEQSVNTARIVQSLGTVVTANGGQLPNLSTPANGVNTAGSQQLAMLQQQFTSMTTQLATIVRNTGSAAGTLTAAAQGGQPLMTVVTV